MVRPSHPQCHSPCGARDLRELRFKYEQILALRVAHARARHEPDFEEPDPRGPMAALAERFPGALRELDRTSLDVLRARIRALEAAAADLARVEPWMRAQVMFHRLARGALASKRWLGRRRRITDAHRDALVRAIDAGEVAPEACMWVDELGAVARPPRGRLLDLVFARLAAELAVGVDEARARVFAAT